MSVETIQEAKTVATSIGVSEYNFEQALEYATDIAPLDSDESFIADRVLQIIVEEYVM